MRKRGLTLVELIIAFFILTAFAGAIIQMGSASSKGALDAHYEFLAFQIAHEPIEILRGLGYPYLADYVNYSLPSYPIGEDKEIKMTAGGIIRPAEATMFKRRIDLDQVEKDGIRGIKITVTVFPANQNRVKTWMTRNKIQLSAIVYDQSS